MKHTEKKTRTLPPACPGESWKRVTYHGVASGIYWISSEGRLWNAASGKILNPSPDKAGYKVAHLIGIDGKPVSVHVHRLVALAFVPRPRRGRGVKLIINHKDESKANNKASNLEWVTYRENLFHKGAFFRRIAKIGIKGILCHADGTGAQYLPTRAEAARISGLSDGCLRRMARTGRVVAGYTYEEIPREVAV